MKDATKALHLLLLLIGLALAPMTVQAQTFTDCASQTVIAEIECDALVALYNSTDGANWTDNTGWLGANNPCIWFGVRCSGGSVAHLLLDRNNLAGSLPTDLGNLTGLQTVRLSRNQLIGTIPEQLGNLSNITSLDLRENNLSGAIPARLGSLGNVTSFNLSQNNLNGAIPASFSGLSSVSFLSLSRNQLSGPVPPSLGTLTPLRSLDLSTNQLTGPIPPELGNLNALTSLSLGNNQFSGPIPPSLGNLPNLRLLNLQSNGVSGPIPVELGNLSAMQSLNLSLNALTGAIPPELGNLINLSGLNLFGNDLSGVVPLSVATAGSNAFFCTFRNNDLCMPDTPAYQALGNPICGILLTSTCVTNAPPIADAGQNQTAECAGPDGAAVTLNGNGSSDPDGDPLTFTWTNAGGAVLATGATHTLTLPLGTHTLTLTVDDGNGGTASDDVDVTVEDTTEPTITVLPDPLTLWPPNHKYYPIALADFVTGASDVCAGTLSPSDVTINSVTSDEPEDATGGGDGNTLNDIVIGADCQSAQLRAERLGGGNGRVYTVNIAATDANGNTGTASFQVHVPHDTEGTAVDDGPAYGESCGAGKHEPTAAPVAAEAPSEYVLEGNYPNPFNPETRIRYALPEASPVKLAVYDVLGRQVRVLVDGVREAGVHEAVFDAHGLPSGTYLYRLETPQGSFVQTMQLVK